MSYKTKRDITNVIAGVILLIAYIIYASGPDAPAPEDLKGWAVLMLMFIGFGIVVMIITQIIFHIVLSIGITMNEANGIDENVERIIDSLSLEDEMDELINLKALRVGYVFAGIGFLAALLALAFDANAVTMLNMLFGSFIIATLAERTYSAYLYEKGVKNV